MIRIAKKESGLARFKCLNGLILFFIPRVNFFDGIGKIIEKIYSLNS